MRSFLLTWACYGTHLPGQPGVVTRELNQFGGPLPDTNEQRLKNVAFRMPQRAYMLDHSRAQVVLSAIHEVCSHRDWTLWAAHARTTHVHVVVTVGCKPEQILHDFKVFSTRALNEPGRRHWARHGSTRYLWTPDSLSAAIHYLVHEQGTPMAVYESTEPRR